MENGNLLDRNCHICLKLTIFLRIKNSILEIGFSSKNFICLGMLAFRKQRGELKICNFLVPFLKAF